MSYDPSTGQYPAARPLSPSDEKLWATLTHIGGIFFSFVPALIVYLVFKDRGPFLRQHATAALNFQLTALIAYLAAGVLSGTFILAIIGAPLAFVVGIVVIIFGIIAAVAANDGRPYTYPLSIPFIK